jgi:hypothetical protein
VNSRKKIAEPFRPGTRLFLETVRKEHLTLRTVGIFRHYIGTVTSFILRPKSSYAVVAWGLMPIAEFDDKERGL